MRQFDIAAKKEKVLSDEIQKWKNKYSQKEQELEYERTLLQDEIDKLKAKYNKLKEQYEQELGGGATQLKNLIKTLEERIEELKAAIKLQKEKIEKQTAELRKQKRYYEEELRKRDAIIVNKEKACQEAYREQALTLIEKDEQKVAFDKKMREIKAELEETKKQIDWINAAHEAEIRKFDFWPGRERELLDQIKVCQEHIQQKQKKLSEAVAQAKKKQEEDEAIRIKVVEENGELREVIDTHEAAMNEVKKEHRENDEHWDARYKMLETTTTAEINMLKAELRELDRITAESQNELKRMAKEAEEKMEKEYGVRIDFLERELAATQESLKQTVVENDNYRTMYGEVSEEKKAAQEKHQKQINTEVRKQRKMLMDNENLRKTCADEMAGAEQAMRALEEHLMNLPNPYDAENMELRKSLAISKELEKKYLYQVDRNESCPNEWNNA